MKSRPKGDEVRTTSGNVFADLAVPDPEQELVRAELIKAICSLVSEREFRQVDLAARLGISQPKVSLLLRGRTAGFSTAMLMRFLNRLGQRIDIVIKPARPGMIGETRVDRDGAALVEHRAPACGRRVPPARSASVPAGGTARGGRPKKK